MAEQIQTQRSKTFIKIVEFLTNRGYYVDETKKEVTISQYNLLDMYFKINEKDVVEVLYPDNYQGILTAQRFYDMCKYGNIPVTVSRDSSTHSLKELIDKLSTAVKLAEESRK